MSVNKQKVYSSEFKESAVKLANESKVPLAQIARELGINKNNLYILLVFQELFFYFIMASRAHLDLLISLPTALPMDS